MGSAFSSNTPFFHLSPFTFSFLDAAIVRSQRDAPAVGFVIVVIVTHEVVFAVRRFPRVDIKEGPQAASRLHFRPQRLPLGFHDIVEPERKGVAHGLVERPNVRRGAHRGGAQMQVPAQGESVGGREHSHARKTETIPGRLDY